MDEKLKILVTKVLRIDNTNDIAIDNYEYLSEIVLKIHNPEVVI